MYRLLVEFPRMWAEGCALAKTLDIPYTTADLDHVVVAGMGGSAIGGDLMRTFVASSSPLPVSVCRNYELPGYVSDRTLFIASSYSGNTEETLFAFEAALRRKAKIVCITSGGAMLERARQNGLPHLVIPGGLPPRAALPYSFSPVLEVAVRLGLVDLSDADATEAIAVLEDGSATLADLSGNPALDLARDVQDHLALVYSGPGWIESVNLRWRGQLEENAKTLAFGNLFPELNHNEIVGWSHSRAFLDRVGVLVLRDQDDPPKISRRMEVTRSILEPRAAFWREIHATGTGRLARMLSLVQFGDWLSLYLAVLNGVDPTPVELIDTLKLELGRTP